MAISISSVIVFRRFTANGFGVRFGYTIIVKRMISVNFDSLLNNLLNRLQIFNLVFAAK